MSLEAASPVTGTVAITSECPDCAGTVSFTRPPLNGEIIVCDDCGLELEVISREPLRLEAAPEVEEDWGE